MSISICTCGATEPTVQEERPMPQDDSDKRNHDEPFWIPYSHARITVVEDQAIFGAGQTYVRSDRLILASPGS